MKTDHSQIQSDKTTLEQLARRCAVEIELAAIGNQVGQEGTHVILTALQSVSNPLREEVERLNSQISDLRTALKQASENNAGFIELLDKKDADLTTLKSSLAKAEADAAAMREVLAMCRDVEGSNSASYDPQEYIKAIDSALSTTTGTELLSKLERFEKALREIAQDCGFFENEDGVPVFCPSRAAILAQQALSPAKDHRNSR